tara:strand:- start:2567 stop:2776 length:210 start_codon:yes stop_codon:yes gene_type:complete
MAKSMDKVPQADGTYKWEMVEITQEYLAERAAKEEALANGTAFPGAKAEAKPKTTRRKKSTKVEESTNS